MPCKRSEERMCNEHKEMNLSLFVVGIDPQLETAGWYLHDHSKAKTEILMDGLFESLLRESFGW